METLRRNNVIANRRLTGWRFLLCACLIFMPGVVVSEELRDLSYPMTADDTRHFLSRTGIGVAPADFVKYRQLTRQQAIDTVMSEFESTPFTPQPAWVNLPVPHYHAKQDMGDEERAAFKNERNKELSQLRAWWVAEMLQTPSPQTERMVLFWHDIFATNYQGTNLQSLAMARQNQVFRKLGMGGWDTLLKAMIRDSALLEFLNAGSNHKNSPNENLGRELLELFTLGVGNYDEGIVKEAARTLTGHNNSLIHDLAFHFQSWKHDTGTKVLFDVVGEHRGDDLIDLILAQPAASSSLARRFWHAFISDTVPDDRWLSSVADTFRRSNFEVAILYRTMLESEAFWAEKYRGALIKSPVDIIAGTARSLEYPKQRWRQFAGWQSTLGMNLFAPPNVAGWKEGGAFITPGHLLNRYRFMKTLVNSNSPTKKEQQGTMMAAGMGNKSTAILQLKLAAENYRGPVEYQVTIFAGNSEGWQSETLSFKHGIDTEQEGEISDDSELNWVTQTIEVPSAALSKATHIDVTYLNDDAGPGGDRNFYVDGVILDENWLDSEDATQFSECPPELSANAGNLYCAGYVRFNVAAVDSLTKQQLPLWRASAVHVGWASDNKRSGQQRVTLTLDHVSTPDKEFHTVQFVLHSSENTYARLELETFGCWPACLEEWPECAREDALFTQSKRLYFPRRSSAENFWQSEQLGACHYNSLESQDKELVNMLWHNVGYLLEKVNPTARAQRFEPILDKVRANLAANDIALNDTPYAGEYPVLEIDSNYAPAAHTPTLLPDITPSVSSEQQLTTLLQTVDLPVEHLLMPFVSDQEMGGLSISEWVAQPEFQLK